MSGAGRRWKVGELARATGLTVRALHYFDQIGVLCPSERSTAGHRVYTAGDVRRLYRVLALRDLGLPLGAVARVLDGPAAGLEPVVRENLARVDRRLAVHRRSRRRLVALLDAMAATRDPSIDRLLDDMEAMMESGYFTPGQLTRLKARHRTLGDEGLAGWQREWADIAEEVRGHIANGVDPAAPAAQATAARWSAFTHRLTGGDRSVLSAMYAKLDGKGPEAATRGVVDTQVWDYIRRAFAVGYGPAD
ncbi:MerR family transcriptional regulator [Sphaerisporangium sp. TRM90804]|uniref:MerR family transcriptional regulator n=1 Tax=Sphaerisporangium sp. TRM90804 TaxID=3031113 RepID=UPI00244BAF38|nr:MerR family transcriptional regulator [Sphaerisporangium sp. TRM90804]MDH2428988.1 MerR family transcriptional regulator [Sphaerisporangium sp. TRM90804]